MSVQRLRELPEDMRVAAASVVLIGGRARDIDVLESIEILSEIARDTDCDPGRRSHILDVVSNLGLKGVEALCLRVSGVDVSNKKSSLRENLRCVMREVCEALEDESMYPCYLTTLSRMSFEHMVRECDRVGSIRYAQDLLYGYAPLLRHLEDKGTRDRVSEIHDAVAFS